MVLLKDVMRPTTKVAATTNITDVAKLMMKKGISSVLVEKGSHIEGIVTERDIIRRVVAKGDDPNTVEAGSIISKPLVKVDIDDDPVAASDLMTKHNIRRVVVTEKGTIVGIFSARMFVKHFKHFAFQRRSKDHSRHMYTR